MIKLHIGFFRKLITETMFQNCSKRALSLLCLLISWYSPICCWSSRNILSLWDSFCFTKRWKVRGLGQFLCFFFFARKHERKSTYPLLLLVLWIIDTFILKWIPHLGPHLVEDGPEWSWRNTHALSPRPGSWLVVGHISALPDDTFSNLFVLLQCPDPPSPTLAIMSLKNAL